MSEILPHRSDGELELVKPLRTYSHDLDNLGTAISCKISKINAAKTCNSLQKFTKKTLKTCIASVKISCNNILTRKQYDKQWAGHCHAE